MSFVSYKPPIWEKVIFTGAPYKALFLLVLCVINLYHNYYIVAVVVGHSVCTDFVFIMAAAATYVIIEKR